MKTKYRQIDNEMFLDIEICKQYKDNYKVHMLEENSFLGIPKVSVIKEENSTVYRFKVTNLKSVKDMYRINNITKDEIESLLESLMNTIYELSRYMIDEDGILLYPELIFTDGSRWMFCYIPVKSKGFIYCFKKLIDYLIKNTDTSDGDSLLYMHKLYTAAINKDISISSIEEFIRDNAEKKVDSDMAEISYLTSEDEWRKEHMVCEKPEEKGFFKTMAENIKKKRENKYSN